MPRAKRQPRIGLRVGPGFVWLLGLLAAAFSADSRAAEPQGKEQLSAWRYVQDVQLPPARTAKLDDFVLTVAVFDGARSDLADLRLYDPSGREVPYAFRVRRPDYRDEAINAAEFNR